MGANVPPGYEARLAWLDSRGVADLVLPAWPDAGQNEYWIGVKQPGDDAVVDTVPENLPTIFLTPSGLTADLQASLWLVDESGAEKGVVGFAAVDENLDGGPGECIQLKDTGKWEDKGCSEQKQGALCEFLPGKAHRAVRRQITWMVNVLKSDQRRRVQPPLRQPRQRPRPRQPRRCPLVGSLLPLSWCLYICAGPQDCSGASPAATPSPSTPASRTGTPVPRSTIAAPRASAKAKAASWPRPTLLQPSRPSKMSPGLRTP